MPRRQSPKTLALAKRDARALQLFQLGWTYQAIADHKFPGGPGGTLFGGDRGNCYRTIRKLISDVTREPAEEARTTELLRLDMFLKSLSERVLRGDTQAINTALKISEQRNKLLGLYEPIKIENSGGPLQVLFSPALQSSIGMADPEIDVERQQ